MPVVTAFPGPHPRQRCTARLAALNARRPPRRFRLARITLLRLQPGGPHLSRSLLGLPAGHACPALQDNPAYGAPLRLCPLPRPAGSDEEPVPAPLASAYAFEGEGEPGLASLQGALGVPEIPDPARVDL
jgi:hypothetical protein